MNLQYSKKVMQNFFHPKNMGEMKSPDGVGKIGNPVCGDIMQVQIKVEHPRAYPETFSKKGLQGAKMNLS